MHNGGGDGGGAPEGLSSSPPGRSSLAQLQARRPARHAPRPSAGARIVTASGREVDRSGLAQEFVEQLRSMQGSPWSGRRSFATIHSVFPEERRLGQDPTETSRRIGEITSPEAIVASGGVCAPIAARYALEQVSSQARPVRDALVGFQADHGGIRYVPPPVLSDVLANQVGAAITVVTEAEDEAGPTKTVQTVSCGTETEVLVSAIVQRLRFGNMAGRFYPEQVQTWLELTGAAHARTAEATLLTGIAAGSTPVNNAAAPAGMGFLRSLVGEVAVLAAGMRDRHRIPSEQPLRMLLPRWAIEAGHVDVAWQAPGDGTLAATRAEITSWLRAHGNVTLTETLDVEAGGTFGAQPVDGAGLDFPQEVVWYLFPEGSWLFLDGGTLDLGVVRDSTLNTTNDFETFAETFENVAFVGVESLRVRTAVCVSGIAQLPADVNVCGGIGS
ncbi:MAG: major capsid protein [Acidimicrobiia bacterium]|nr:major capsid protein [Acidimicrobiia bacterium]